jgi:hypothetical protein
MNQNDMVMTGQNLILLSNRSGKDRRTKSGFNIRSLLSGGRRKKVRRQEDTRRIFYVDNYSPGLFYVVTTIVFLCALDALLTLHLLHHDAYEMNPFMAFFLKFGPYTFFTCKYLLTIISVMVLLMFRNINLRMIKISAPTALHIMAVFYILVVAWELYLIFNMADKPDYRLLPEALTGAIMIC